MKTNGYKNYVFTPVEVGLYFADGYIGQPYWPELNLLIDIKKEIHPRLSEERKRQALDAALQRRGLALEDYERIEALSKRPFYTLDGSEHGEIIIPQRVIHSFLNNTSQRCPRLLRKIENKGMTFIGVRVDGGHM